MILNHETPENHEKDRCPEAAASAVAFLFRLNTDQRRDQSFDYAHDQARRFLQSRGMRLATKDHIELTELKGKCRTTICAICGRVEFIHIALRAYALRLWLRAQTPQLRFGNILFILSVCCFAPAKRMWPEGLIASFASDVKNHAAYLVHPVCFFSLFGQDLQDRQD